MKNYQILLLWTMFFVLAEPVYSQDKPVIPYVDMGTAQTLVDTLLKENETLKADAEKFRKEVVSFTGQITADKKLINDLAPILDEVKARNGEIATISEALSDRGLKAKSAMAAQKNKAGEKKLIRRIDELGAQVIDLGKLIEFRQFQVAVNDAKAARNNEAIILLQATLSKTKLQEAHLQAVIDQIELLSAKVDSYLQQTSTPAP